MATKNFLEEFKIEAKVFERRTLFTIYELMKKRVIESVESLVKEGKESVVVAAKDSNKQWIALKIYRTEHCDFKSMWKYLISDPRFARVKKNRWAVVTTWAKREFKNMKKAFSAGVSCPEPITVLNNVLVMSFIGKDGIPAPTLLQAAEAEWQKVYDEVVEEMKKLAKARIIHTDLSPYNILLSDKAYIIDFSQGVPASHPLAKEFLERDVKNINSFFAKKNVHIQQELYKSLLEAYYGNDASDSD